MDCKAYFQSREFEAPFVRIRGRMSRGGTVSWSPCIRTGKGDRRQMETSEGDEPQAILAHLDRWPLTIVLVDYRGDALAATPAYPVFFSSTQEWGTFVVRMPYRENVHAIRLMRGRETVLGELEVPTCRPYFSLLRPKRDSFIDSKGVLHLHWADHDSQMPLTYFVRYTHNGRDWYRPGVNLRASDYYLDLRRMPGGPHCIAQVLATNGYRTSYVQTRPFEVAVKPLRISFGDAHGPTLFAQGFSVEDGPIAGAGITWLDGSGNVLAHGGDFDARQLPDGHHTVRVSVRSSSSSRIQELGVYEGGTGRRVLPPPR